MIYIKRIVNADITRQIDLTKEAATSFFNFEETHPERMVSFEEKTTGFCVNGFIKKTGHTFTITGSIFSEIKKKCQLNDIIIIESTNTADKYKYIFIKATDGEYAKYDTILDTFSPRKNLRGTHVLLALDDNFFSQINKHPLQQIFYGAPGTGKSHTIKEQTKGDDTVIRTTFHPDSDYSTFVGCYKPTMEDEEVRVVPVVVTSGISLDQNNGTYKEKRITYKFVQQAFTKAYIQAWEKMANYQPIDRIFLVNSVQYEIIGISKDSITVKKLSDSDANEPIKIAKSRLKEIYNASDSDNAVEQGVVSKLEGLDQKSFDDAWTVLEKGFLKPQFLIIEEINRGNCAQIFGDLFQLLDRGDYGYSEYPIVADDDLKKILAEEFNNLNFGAVKHEIDSIFSENYPTGITDRIKNGELLVLPKNLYIWATMNTSDQSLFPIDSAFKRRWDWKYVPIVQGYDKKTGTMLEWKIKVGDKEYDWWKFLQAINRHIGDTTKSEDKKLGYFFCKAENGIITAETFVGKVLFYLWNDVYKDYDHSPAFFRDDNGQLIEYGEYYVQDASHNTIPNIELVKSFIEKVEPEFKANNSTQETDN